MPCQCTTSAAGDASASRHAGSQVGYLRIHEACLQATSSLTQNKLLCRLVKSHEWRGLEKQVCSSRYELRHDTSVSDIGAHMLPQHVMS